VAVVGDMTTSADRLQDALSTIADNAQQAIHAVHDLTPAEVGPDYWYQQCSALHRALLALGCLFEEMGHRIDQLPKVHGARLFNNGLASAVLGPADTARSAGTWVRTARAALGAADRQLGLAWTQIGTLGLRTDDSTSDGGPT
jgi:hypothetical protein